MNSSGSSSNRKRDCDGCVKRHQPQMLPEHQFDLLLGQFRALLDQAQTSLSDTPDSIEVHFVFLIMFNAVFAEPGPFLLSLKLKLRFEITAMRQQKQQENGTASRKLFIPLVYWSMKRMNDKDERLTKS